MRCRAIKAMLPQISHAAKHTISFCESSLTFLVTMLDSRWNSFIASSTVMVFDALFRPFIPFVPSALAELFDDVTVLADREPLKPLVLMRTLPMAAAKFNSSSDKPLKRKARLGRS